MSFVLESSQNDDEQFFVTEIVELLNDERWATSESPDEPLVRKPKLKNVRPRPDNKAEITPKKQKKATPRVRNKGKIELLRYEIKALEAVLSNLQHSPRGTEVLKQRRAESMWHIIAMRQKSKREQAEHCNMKLKKLVAEQSRLTWSLQRELDECNSFPAPELSFSAAGTAGA